MSARAFHPVVWWLWAASIALCLARANSFYLSCIVVLIAGIVVRQKSEDAPWALSFTWALKIGLWIVSIRVLFGVIVGVPMAGRTLFTLPLLPLPSWMTGIRIGGPVMQERLLTSTREGIMLAAIIAILAAASSLTNPHRLLRSLPLVVYEFGVAVVIATSMVPQLVASVKRIREAQKIRGQNLRGLKSWRRVALPLLEDALSRSLDLAASMDSRGYGITRRRTKYRPTSWQLNEYFLVLASGFALIIPMFSLFLVAMPLALAPRQNFRVAA